MRSVRRRTHRTVHLKTALREPDLGLRSLALPHLKNRGKTHLKNLNSYRGGCLVPKNATTTSFNFNETLVEEMV